MLTALSVVHHQHQMHAHLSGAHGLAAVLAQASRRSGVDTVSPNRVGAVDALNTGRGFGSGAFLISIAAGIPPQRWPQAGASDPHPSLRPHLFPSLPRLPLPWRGILRPTAQTLLQEPSRAVQPSVVPFQAGRSLRKQPCTEGMPTSCQSLPKRSAT